MLRGRDEDGDQIHVRPCHERPVLGLYRRDHELLRDCGGVVRPAAPDGRQRVVRQVRQRWEVPVPGPVPETHHPDPYHLVCHVEPLR